MLGQPRRGRAGRALVAISLLLTFLAACGDDDPAADQPATVDEDGDDKAPKPEADEPAPPDNSVTVEDAGAEPREELRFAFSEGDEFRTALTMKIGVEITINGEAAPSQPVPAITIVMAGAIDSVEDGAATVSFVYDEVAAQPEPGIDAASLASFNAALADLNGLSGSMTIDELGAVSDSDIDTSGITDPTMKTTIESFNSQASTLTVPLPSEAVGVGAVWSAELRAVLNGITTDTTNTYTLRSRDGDQYEFDVVQEISAPPGPVDIPGVPPGSEIEIVSYDASNTGSVAGSLTSPLPNESTTAGGGDITMRLTEGGETQDLVQKLTMEIKLAPA